MIRHATIEPKPARPSIGWIEVDFLAQAPLRADTEAVAYDQHSDQQFGIDRWPIHRAVKGGGQLPLNAPNSTNLSIDCKRWSAETCFSRENS
jgi:hypothetical protein